MLESLLKYIREEVIWVFLLDPAWALYSILALIPSFMPMRSLQVYTSQSHDAADSRNPAKVKHKKCLKHFLNTIDLFCSETFVTTCRNVWKSVKHIFSVRYYAATVLVCILHELLKAKIFTRPMPYVIFLTNIKVIGTEIFRNIPHYLSIFISKASCNVHSERHLKPNVYFAHSWSCCNQSLE